MDQFSDSWYCYQFRYCSVNNLGLIRLANALDVSADLLLGTAISTYNSTMLKDIEQRIQLLPDFKQQRLLDIFDAIISVELNHDQCERP